MEIKLSSGAMCLIDDEDYELVKKYNWSENKPVASKTSYAHARVNKIPTYMHRLILAAQKGKVVDHINGNGLDNRKENLRIVSIQENMFNRRTRGTTTSKYYGVFKQKGRSKYRAAVRHPILGRIYAGSFDTEKEAAEEYNFVVKLYNLNLPLNVIED